MSTYDALLDVQQLDTDGDVLRHRLVNLPERAELASRESALAAIRAELAPTLEERHRIERMQKSLEDEIALLAEKVAGVERQMYGGGSSNAKELQSLQDELDSFARRRAQLEDQLLEQMLLAEPIDAELGAADARTVTLDAEAKALLVAVAEAESAIEAGLAEVAAKREAAVAAVGDAALVARYEGLRTRFKGVAIARFEGGSCTGCHLHLPAAEAEAVRRQARDEGIAECPECDRLLVVP